MTDDYDTNTYLPMQVRNSTNTLVPTIGYNPDDGLKIGLTDTSYGGGFFVNGADILTARAALFNSKDGLRFSFGLGFGF